MNDDGHEWILMGVSCPNMLCEFLKTLNWISLKIYSFLFALNC